MAIGHAAFAEVIADLVADFERNDPDRIFKLDIGHLRHGYSDCIDLTVYRCVQEGLTNAARHAGANSIAISLEEKTVPVSHLDGSSISVALLLSILDDGRGLVPGASRGLGLIGMEERVSALGGTFAVSSGRAGGTCLDITIPLEDVEPSGAAPADSRNGRQ